MDEIIRNDLELITGMTVLVEIDDVLHRGRVKEDPRHEDGHLVFSCESIERLNPRRKNGKRRTWKRSGIPFQRTPSSGRSSIRSPGERTSQQHDFRRVPFLTPSDKES